MPFIISLGEWPLFYLLTTLDSQIGCCCSLLAVFIIGIQRTRYSLCSYSLYNLQSFWSVFQPVIVLTALYVQIVWSHDQFVLTVLYGQVTESHDQPVLFNQALLQMAVSALF